MHDGAPTPAPTVGVATNVVVDKNGPFAAAAVLKKSEQHYHAIFSTLKYS